MKASFNPLLADRILSITVPIKVRCSSKTDAYRNMSINVSGASGFLEAAVGVRTPFEGICLLDPRVISGCKPDSPGPVLLVPVGTATPDPGRPKFHLQALSPLSPAPLVDREGSSRTTPRSRPPYWVRRPVEVSRFPSSLEVDPPRRRTVEEDCAPDCKYTLNVTLVA